MNILKICFAFFALAITGAGAAHSEECKDVLVNKIMDVADVKKDTYYRTTVLTTLSESTDNQTNSNASIDIPGIGAASYGDANHLAESLSSSSKFDEIRRDKSSYLIMSGQKAIVDAWRDCMKTHGGMSLTIERLDEGRHLLLHIVYFESSSNTADPVKLKLYRKVDIDGREARIVSGNDCLAKGKVYGPGDECDVTLVPASPWSAFPMVFPVKTLSQKAPKTLSYSVYVAPRATLEARVQPWPASGPATTKRTYAWDHATFSEVECFDASDGYVLLEKSIKITPRPEGAAIVASCFSQMGGDVPYQIEASGRRLCVRQVNRDMVQGDKYCSLSITGTQAAMHWNPEPPANR
jgi:hypothetical protein